jgi:hypothetical protein
MNLTTEELARLQSLVNSRRHALRHLVQPYRENVAELAALDALAEKLLKMASPAADEEEPSESVGPR